MTRCSARVFAGDGRDTGVVLSGGQWQRVALARTLLRDRRDLMIMDEPSSGLDAEAEHMIHATLRAVRGGQTSILVSHRLGTARQCDHIVVLEGGQIAAQGTHDDLMNAGGRYARLFRLQAAGYAHEHDGKMAEHGSSHWGEALDAALDDVVR
jgi:ATP-binding cassette subfamily B protein